ncbi:MAG: type IIA DNA topoisomerase subunit B, partial [Spirochaetales bacterium]|nr:type IIA DNA topoisomerase subunit B [Spirochaetales bacterium]
VGTKAVNALSSRFLVRSHREGKFFEATFQQGKLLNENQGSTTEPDGTYVEFQPDKEIFADFQFNKEFLEQRMWNYACLNQGLRLYLNKEKFEAKNGLLDLLNAEIGEGEAYPAAYYKGQYLEFAFTHTGSYGETYFSFVNGQHTSDGGTHLSAFREGHLKGINEFYKETYNGLDVREGLTAAVAIKIKNPVFESQTKNKLGNTDIRSWIVQAVKEAVMDFLHKNSETARILKDRIISNEKLRKELNTVKKEAKEAAKKIALNIPKLKDCKYHIEDGEKGAGSMIFITEGQSAAGSMVTARDVYTQAIYALRGKPENLQGKKRTEIYRNEELYNLMMALGIENDVENLRYGKIIIATDADTDGFHIRNLLLSFFLNFFEELVVNGRVYILETPLFRVRNKKETRYCYNAKERDVAVKALAGAEVTRFKGLGEISPNEFGPFIGASMRLVDINIKSLKDIPSTLSFYMGKNTPTRRQYIMENLI